MVGKRGTKKKRLNNGEKLLRRLRMRITRLEQEAGWRDREHVAGLERENRRALKQEAKEKVLYEWVKDLIVERDWLAGILSGEGKP